MKRMIGAMLALILCMTLGLVCFAQESPLQDTMQEAPAQGEEPQAAGPLAEALQSEQEIDPAEDAAAADTAADEQFLQQVLEALDKPVYNITLEALKEEGPLEQNTISETARGLQEMLVDFGCDIEVDASAGPGTFGALNKVLAAFGKESTEAVDADLYAQLLPLLLISKNTDEKYDSILRPHYQEDDDSSEYEYLKGCAYFAAERYYKAKEAFLESKFEDFEERAAGCLQLWPSYGELYHNPAMYSNEMELEFQVNGHTSAEGMCFEVYTEDAELATVLFITGNSSVSTMLPGGAYRIKDGIGTEWYGIKDAFGRHGSYEYLSFYEYDMDKFLTRLDAGYVWTITINITEGNPDATGVGSVDEDWEDWAR